MSNAIESMLAESRSLGRAGQFIHRYETCQRHLAARIESICPDEASAAQQPNVVGTASVTHEGMSGDSFLPGISRTHYLTVFLQAYVAARQFFPDGNAPAASADLFRVTTDGRQGIE